jgi:hypothetical protein
MTRYLDLAKSAQEAYEAQKVQTDVPLNALNTLNAQGEHDRARGDQDLNALNTLTAQVESPALDPLVRRALGLFEGRIVPETQPERPVARPVRRATPARGSRVALAMVELPALRHGHRPEDNELERTRVCRVNIARRVWRLERLDGVPTGSGLFVGVDEATSYARERGWHLDT